MKLFNINDIIKIMNQPYLTDSIKANEISLYFRGIDRSIYEAEQKEKIYDIVNALEENDFDVQIHLTINDLENE